MKILLVGLGSIGRRHLSCLEKLEGVQIAALRTSKGTLKEASSYQEFTSTDEALAFNPDGVIISNPTALHAKYAIPFLKEGIKVLIEKPVTESVETAIPLSDYSENIRVAYCMRFLPVASFLKDRFKKENPFKVSFKRSFYLPNWHPYADYRKEYTARKDLGGGVLRTLSHEIDLALSWVGAPTKVMGYTDNVSFLETDVDDLAWLSLKTADNTRVNFELDYFSPSNINLAEAFTEKGKYTWNLEKAWFQAYKEAKPKPIAQVKQREFVKVYEDQMLDFISFIKSGKSKNASLSDGVEVLKIIESVDTLN